MILDRRLRFFDFQSCHTAMRSKIKILNCYVTFIIKPTVVKLHEMTQGARLRYIRFFDFPSWVSGIGPKIWIIILPFLWNLWISKFIESYWTDVCRIAQYMVFTHVTNEWGQIREHSNSNNQTFLVFSDDRMKWAGHVRSPLSARSLMFPFFGSAPLLLSRLCGNFIRWK